MRTGEGPPGAEIVLPGHDEITSRRRLKGDLRRAAAFEACELTRVDSGCRTGIVCHPTMRIDQETPAMEPGKRPAEKLTSQFHGCATHFGKPSVASVLPSGDVQQSALLKGGRAARQVGDGADRAPIRDAVLVSAGECAAPVLQRDGFAGEQFDFSILLADAVGPD